VKKTAQYCSCFGASWQTLQHSCAHCFYHALRCLCTCLFSHSVFLNVFIHLFFQVPQLHNYSM